MPGQKQVSHRNLLWRLAIRGRNEIKRSVYRQRIRWGLTPRHPELLQADFARLRSVCVFLGPYRNLTTLTASLLSLHPNCQVLNHSGFQILEDPQLNFFADPSPTCLRRFLQYVITASQGGTGGDQGGSITLSHAFRDENMRDTFKLRYGDKLEKDEPRCYVWKESLAVTNYLRANKTDFRDLFERNPQLRFLLPVRNPMDCAVSNAKTGHGKRFDGVISHQNATSVLNAVVREIAWFRQLQQEFPDRFFAMFQFQFDANHFRELARFLDVSPEERWVRDALTCCQVKASYDHDAEFVATFRDAIDRHFSNDPLYRDRLRSFVA